MKLLLAPTTSGFGKVTVGGYEAKAREVCKKLDENQPFLCMNIHFGVTEEGIQTASYKGTEGNQNQEE